MKVAPKLIFLFKDPQGLGSAISDALQPNPNSNLKKLEDSFELSLERYGIRDHTASGNLIHFVDPNGLYQDYEPPVLACAINEVLAAIVGENLSALPSIICPVIVPASKLKLEAKSSSTNNGVPLYGMPVGPETEVTKALNSKFQKPPSSLQIYYEPLACFLQLVRVLNIPTYVLIGQTGLRTSNKNSGEDLEVIHKIGEHLVCISSLCFLRERIAWTPVKTSRDREEPWRVLYG